MDNLASGLAGPQAVRAAGRVKGTLLIARLRYLATRGPESRERVLRHLTAADQVVVRGVVLPSSWYPADLLLRLEMTIAAVLARGDRTRVFVDMGRCSADTNLSPGGVQRPYLREGDPHFLLRNVPRMYSSQHSSGHRTCDVTGPRSAVIRSHECADTTTDDCLTTVGWLEQAIVLSGGKGVRVVETQCMARGAACCEYRCDWNG
ncbi:MAG TPA: TIGR02265 family protein [Anaeromyxobacteraceae bacterium]|nr:TIGR02265 family protein [Anaeromyxobacteraceae bacterium]